MSRYQSLETKLIHAGEPKPRIEGAITMPIFQTAMFEYDGATTAYSDLKYARLNNLPNHLALHQKLAALENAEAGLVTASGMAAITTTLMSFLKPGDHVLVARGLYGGTHHFIVEDLREMGVDHGFVDGDDPASWPRELKPSTRVFYSESMTNPMLEVIDHQAVVAFAREHGLVSMVDNTFASPVNFRPIEIGYDLCLHSGTKFLNGHSDLAAGAVVGPTELITKITHKLNILGGSLDPHACFLLHRGLKTLAVRIKHQNQSALEIARFLEGHAEVERVYYPGLASHGGHERARALFDGFGGLLSFQVKGGQDRIDNLVRHLELPVLTFSLGGVESLIVQPARTSHATIPREERLALGITDTLLRLSVGLEATADLIQDMDHALMASKA